MDSATDSEAKSDPESESEPGPEQVAVPGTELEPEPELEPEEESSQYNMFIQRLMHELGRAHPSLSGQKRHQLAQQAWDAGHRPDTMPQALVHCVGVTFSTRAVMAEQGAPIEQQSEAPSGLVHGSQSEVGPADHGSEPSTAIGSVAATRCGRIA
jgi:hypothetical protein